MSPKTTFQQSTHPNDSLINKEQFLTNKKNVLALIYNLGILLSNDCTPEENDKYVSLPIEEDVFSMFGLKTSNDQENATEGQNVSEKNKTITASNELCAIIWDHRGKLNWLFRML